MNSAAMPARFRQGRGAVEVTSPGKACPRKIEGRNRLGSPEPRGAALRALRGYRQPDPRDPFPCSISAIYFIRDLFYPGEIRGFTDHGLIFLCLFLFRSFLLYIENKACTNPATFTTDLAAGFGAGSGAGIEADTGRSPH
jgi:hypothetical protein